MDFGLKVDEAMLVEQARYLVQMGGDGEGDSAVVGSLARAMELRLPEPRRKKAAGEDNGALTPRTVEKRKASSSLPVRPVQHVGQGIGIVGQS